MRCFRYSAEGVLVECADMGETFREHQPRDATLFGLLQPQYTRTERRRKARHAAGPHRSRARTVSRWKLIEPAEIYAVDVAYARHAIRAPARGTVGLYLRLGEPVRQAYLDDIARELRR